MKAKKVSVSLGQTFNTGNYESARVDVMVEGTIEDEETVDQATERAYVSAKKSFAKIAANFVPKKG